MKKGEGHFERYMGKWRVQHVECCIIGREEKEAALSLKLELSELSELSDSDKIATRLSKEF